MSLDRSAAALLGAALGAVVLAACGSARDEAACDRPFDRAAWNLRTSVEPIADGRSRRAILVDRLIRCETLQGAARGHVRQLLGEPDRTSRTDDGAPIWAYLVGPGSLMLDSEELLIIFHRGRVATIQRTY